MSRTRPLNKPRADEATILQITTAATARAAARTMGERRRASAIHTRAVPMCFNDTIERRQQVATDDSNSTLKPSGRRRRTSLEKTRRCCTRWPRASKSQTNQHTPRAQQARRSRVSASAVSYSIVILTLLLACPASASSQLPQYQRQRSPIYPQQQQQQHQRQHQYQPASPLVNNLQAAYQNDQPASQAARQQQPSSFQADLDNVIESTTTNSNLHQAFPLVSGILNAAAAAASASSRPLYQQQQTCQLPVTWAGKWFQLNKDTIRVTNSEISDKGLCRDRKGDKFLFEQAPKLSQSGASTAAAPCLVCLVINERHLNVLQYKESACQPIPAQYLNRTANGQLDNDHSLLDTICSDITGDAQLESMFRLDTPATECPISGKYQFTYDTCREPLSSLDSCIDKKQLNFKFSACQDVGESKSEVLKCYADWSEGNNYYMIGRLEHASNQQDKGKFRCFLYEKSADGDYIQMAQSLEESCYGLINANEGPKTLRLSARQPTSNKCHFPAFIQSQSANWLSVDNSLIYMFNANSSKYQVKETREGNVIEEASCLEQVRHPHAQQPLQAHAQQHQARSIQTSAGLAGQAPSSRRYPPSSNHFNNQIDQAHHQGAPSSSRQTINDVVYLVQITKNCYTTDYCVRFYRRTSGIVQIDYFMALAGEDGQQRCRNAFIGAQPQTQIITTNLEQQRCPFEGAYTIEAPLESDFSYNPSNIFICPRQSYLTAQCDDPTRLRIHYKCSPAKYMIKNLYCLGSWSTNGLVRLLLSDDERQRYSAWYRDLTAAATTTTTALGDEAALTRSQQLLGLTTGGGGGGGAQPQAAASASINSIAPVVDLQIALITALPTVSKPMQVRLTRRSQCSELRGYSSQGSLGPISSSYAAPAASSAAALNLAQLTSAFLCSTALALLSSLWQARAVTLMPSSC